MKEQVFCPTRETRVRSIHRRTAIWAAMAAASALTAPAHAQSGITDMGTLGGNRSEAYAVSADGSVVVGYSRNAAGNDRAFRWTSAGMSDLGSLLGGTDSIAHGVSADGSVVVGQSNGHAFRWTAAGTIDIGDLGGGDAVATAVSANGGVIVGYASTAVGSIAHAFHWSGGVMTDLGELSLGRNSYAMAVSPNGTWVVGDAFINGTTRHAFVWGNGSSMTDIGDLGALGNGSSYAKGVSNAGVVVGYYEPVAGESSPRAFRWTGGGGMTDLGTLGGTISSAWGISADGAVIVGGAATATSYRAFRRTDAEGMQSVEDWLRANGVTVPADITQVAYGVNSDGSVVVGRLANGQAFVARVVGSGGGDNGGGDNGGGGNNGGNGLVSLADVEESLGTAGTGSRGMLVWLMTVVDGAHSRPLSRRVAAGRNTVWVAGDWGSDDHGARSGDLGLAELGLGRNFGAVQVNLSLGQTWARQDLALDGRAEVDGTYLVAEALIPVAGNLWATLGGYGHRGEADLRRAYLNAGVPDASTGRPDVTTWGLRARLDWDQAFRMAGAELSPYADLSYGKAEMDAFTESGGGFPARFDARTETATELRVGVNAGLPASRDLRFLGTLEAAHRFEEDGARTSGEIIGLFGFDLDGEHNERDWLRAAVGLEGRLGGGTASLMLNATTKGEVPDYWLAASWQRTF